MGDREQLLQRAQLAQQAERDEDRASAMKAGTELNEPLSSEGGSPPLWPPRMWLVPGDAPGGPAAALSGKPCRREGEEAGESKAYREEIEKELETVCDEVLALLDKLLIKNGRDFQVESKAFYLQMKGGSYVTWQRWLRGGETVWPKLPWRPTRKPLKSAQSTCGPRTPDSWARPQLRQVLT